LPFEFGGKAVRFSGEPLQTRTLRQFQRVGGLFGRVLFRAFQTSSRRAVSADCLATAAVTSWINA
jgi:hypothetical protein